MVEGYHRRIRPQGVYFRQKYAQDHNQFQAIHAKSPQFVEPEDILNLPGDKKRRKSRKTSGITWTPEAMAEAARKHSTPTTEWQEPST